MSDLRELYQQLIIDHGRNPRNFGEISEPTCQQCGFNPLCGDELTIYIKHDQGLVNDVKFTGSGCAISMASASLMTEALRGKSLTEVEALFSDVHGLLTKQEETDQAGLGKLQALAGVAEYPMRVKCATLAWHAVIAALKNESEPVTTE